MNGLDPKLKTWGVVLGLVVFALAGLDYVVLKGERVASGRVSLESGSTPVVFQLSRSGEEHLIEITTRKRKNGKMRGQSIAYRLVGPDGTTLVEDSEVISHEHRFFDFTPREPGEYSLYAEETTLLGGGRGSGHVEVTVGDHRLLSRWLRF